MVLILHERGEKLSYLLFMSVPLVFTTLTKTVNTVFLVYLIPDWLFLSELYLNFLAFLTVFNKIRFFKKMCRPFI